MGPQSETKLLLVVLALAALPACPFKKEAIPPPGARVTAAPEFVCAGEEVTVSWDAGEQTDSDACRPGLVGVGVGSEPSRSDCIIIERTSTPAQPAWDEAGDLNTQDSRTVPIGTTTTFTATARRGVGEGSESVVVTVIGETEPPGLTALPFVSGGSCLGARAIWEKVKLKDRTSGCLEVTSICNETSPSTPIRLTDADDPSRHDTVLAGNCTEMFNGRAPNLTAAIEGYTPPEGTCGGPMTTGGPPPIRVLVRLQCNRDMPSCAL